MIKVSSNIGSVAHSLSSMMKGMRANVNDQLLRVIATSELALVKHRIHTEGRKADGSQIGTYNNAYLKLREKKYNRNSDPKIIFSLTGQMENDLGVIATDNGYGIGFKIEASKKNKKQTTTLAQIAEWLEEKKGKVYSLTSDEAKAFTPIVNQFLTNNLKK